MPKYLVIYNHGYGEESDVVEADSQEEADKMAYETWKEAVENSADYRAELLTKDNAENYGHEDELEA